jgi:hypothetical protein
MGYTDAMTLQIDLTLQIESFASERKGGPQAPTDARLRARLLRHQLRLISLSFPEGVAPP